MYMDGIRIFAWNVKDLETFIQTIIIYNEDIEMELRIEKFSMLIMKKKKRSEKQQKKSTAQKGHWEKKEF